MSETATFDTHRFVKRLTETGMPEKTAEALADEQVRLIQGNLATKHDIALVKHDIALVKHDIALVQKDIETLRADLTRDIGTLRKETKKDIEALRGDLTRDMATLETRIVKWVAGFGMSIVGLLVAVLFRIWN